MTTPKVKAIPKVTNQENGMKIDYLFAAIVFADIDASKGFYAKILCREAFELCEKMLGGKSYRHQHFWRQRCQTADWFHCIGS